MLIKKIHHIAMVVPDINEALTFWQDALGLDLSHVEDVPAQETKVAFLPTGGSEVELVEPTSDTSGMARYMAKRGPGIHHICFEVEGIEGILARAAHQRGTNHWRRRQKGRLYPSQEHRRRVGRAVRVK
jgi:methylmalonyl-CoA/ethylmalonyl-CoA epimerase